MTEPKSGFWRRFPLPVLAAAVMVVAIGVGIPVGLAAGAGAPRSEPTSPVSLGPTATGTVGPVDTATPTETDEPTEPTETSDSTEPTESTEPTDPTEPTESTESTESTEDGSEPPSGLSAPQRDLWDEMEMEGVDHQSCRGYPDGEQLDGVAASLECDIEDPSMSEPIVYYQFESATAVDDYLGLRGQEIDRVGECTDGDEDSGTWNVDDGQAVGSYVCVDNVKNGESYFKIAFSDAADDTVAVVQDESASDVVAWWQRYADGQFYGVGEN
jgi:hypothetical protein